MRKQITEESSFYETEDGNTITDLGDATYNSHKVMKFNPYYHSNNDKPWSYEELEYLINWYDVTGAIEMSFALERTVETVRQKVCRLRKQGIMS